MTDRRTIVETDESNQPKWDYSQAVMVNGGCLLFTSQIIGMEADGSVAGDDLGRQAEAAHANLEAIIKKAGGTMAHIVRLMPWVGRWSGSAGMSATVHKLNR